MVLTVLATELGFLQTALLTTPLSLPQWLACTALAAITPAVIELDKAIRARHDQPAKGESQDEALLPRRARSTV